MPTLKRFKNSNDFKWDKEIHLDTVQIDKWNRKLIKICELSGKEFVVITDEKFYKETWRVLKNWTCPIECWNDVVTPIEKQING